MKEQIILYMNVRLWKMQLIYRFRIVLSVGKHRVKDKLRYHYYDDDDDDDVNVRFSLCNST